MYDLLTQIKSLLNNINAKTIDLGIEDGISANDTPFIRIVPSSNELAEFNRQNFEFEIYIGTDIKSNLDDTYQEHISFLEEIKNTLHLTQIRGGICYFQKVIFDKDIVKNFKTSMISFIIKDII